VITLHKKTLLPVKFETYTFDLNKANIPGNKPEWYKLHEQTETFGIKNMSP